MSINGALSWDAWPTNAAAAPVNAPISEVFDFAYEVALAPFTGTYMAPISPACVHIRRHLADDRSFYRHQARASIVGHAR